ncbi:hypothetical protein ALC56_08610 [Trachymyrmex septentrionalis]|uniref:Uncharacterized protein n=1 Tax=Trachymyrmex septentrionalis TaxID=34720 RepID=A0A195F9U4_9HYME|nr:hypothetical protein ALC56_08610 [Trachymyrmex septentrionalis]
MNAKRILPQGRQDTTDVHIRPSSDVYTRSGLQMATSGRSTRIIRCSNEHSISSEAGSCHDYIPFVINEMLSETLRHLIACVHSRMQVREHEQKRARARIGRTKAEMFPVKLLDVEFDPGERLKSRHMHTPRRILKCKMNVFGNGVSSYQILRRLKVNERSQGENFQARKESPSLLLVSSGTFQKTSTTAGSLMKSRHETHQRKLSVSEVEAADSGAPHINQRTNQHIDLSRQKTYRFAKRFACKLVVLFSRGLPVPPWKNVHAALAPPI